MKLKKLLSEIGVEQMKVYSNPYATAFKPMEEEIEISKDDMEKLHSDGEVEVDGEKLVFIQEFVNEADDTYHKSYTHAIEAAEVYARKKGYTIENDEMFTKVGMNSKRPSVGKTTRVSLELLKNGKPQKKMLHIQVYGMKNGYELNAYIN